jgi:hypothetical protein
MTTIKETTRKLFNINFEIDLEDDTLSEEYKDIADNLIETNSWSKVYPYWYDYLINECKSEEEILNFANLFWFYDGENYNIPNAIEFCAFFYATISFEHYPDAIEILDSITIDVFLNSGIYPREKLYYDEYIPQNDPIVKKEINKWKEKGYGLQ